MEFRSLATLGAVISAVFGFGFVAAPGPSAEMYGASGAVPFTLLLGRYLGSEMLLFAAALFGLRTLTQPEMQRRVSIAIAIATAVGLGVTLHGVLAGTLNVMGWSSVAIYGFFLLAWGRLGWMPSGIPSPSRN